MDFSTRVSVAELMYVCVAVPDTRPCKIQQCDLSSRLTILLRHDVQPYLALINLWDSQLRNTF
jgi:hypothetical protein